MWSRTLLSLTFSYKSKANEEKTACQKIGKYDMPPADGIGVTPALVQYYYDTYCKKNEDKPLWNGGYAEKAKCYTSTLVCGNINNCATVDCFANVSNQTRCLHREVDFNKCVLAFKAPAQAAPDYGGDRCTTTCSGNIAVGACLPGYAKKCVCEGTLALFRDNLDCTPAAPAATCLYGGNILTTDSYPYKYETASGKFCIVDSKTNKKIAFHCRTNDTGIIAQGSAVSDKEGYCINPTAVPIIGDAIVPASLCGSRNDQWKTEKYRCSDIAEYGKCTTDKQWICRCDDAGKYAWPTLRNNPSECP